MEELKTDIWKQEDIIGRNARLGQTRQMQIKRPVVFQANSGLFSATIFKAELANP